jgi:hypothetical protein
MEKKDLQEIPQFNSEDEEAAFWLEHDMTDYYDASKWVKAEFPNLRKSSEEELDALIEKHRVILEGLDQSK